MAEGWTAVVLTGGRASRLGGASKAELTIGGRALIDHLLADLPLDVPVVIAGRTIPLARTVQFCREDPPFGGPVAGLAAALPLVDTPVVVVLAVDMPNAGVIAQQLASGLLRSTADGMIAVDRVGRMQPLCAAYRTEVLRREMAAVAPANRAVRDLVEGLALDVLAAPEVAEHLDDIDTEDDLARARQRTKGSDMSLATWVTAVQQELGLGEEAIDIDGLLDVARVAAHQVERPAAPLTLYLMGLAVGTGQSSADVAARIQGLAEDWPA